MAAALPYLTVAMAGYSIYSSEEAAGEQEDLAQANSERQRMESEEAVRRLTLRQEQSESQAKAMAAASGVKLTGSVTDYLDLMSKVNKEEADWLVKSGLSAASIMEREGQIEADMTRRSGRANFANTFLTTADKSGWFE